ncbi:MAG: OmcA/MtrC family decaheme c-type cytochrome [Wenzhouxiangellaceae bacterium]
MSAITAGLVICGLLFYGAAIAGPTIVEPGSDDEIEKVVDFFETMPDDVFIQVAPEGWAGADMSINMAGVQVEFLPRPAPSFLIPIIDAAELNNTPVIDFRVYDQFGFGVEGLDQGENVAISFTVNKLVPGVGGKTDSWSTYMRADDEGQAGVSAGTYASGMLEDLGDGNYRFTFSDPLDAISGVSFEPELTHRVGLEIRDFEVDGEEIDTTDTAFDVQPSTGATTGITQREIATQEACASCHGTEDFAFHGGARRDVRQCVSCHQEGAIDAFSGNTLDFAVMIHKIHTGADLNNKPYEFCGFGCERFGAPPDDFSEILYPQSTMNCVKCHDPADEATPQAINIANAPTAETCASCHDDLAFDETGLTNANRNHIGLAQPNSTCAACHSENGLMVDSLEEHRMLAAEAAQTIQYNILSVTNTGEGESPVVTFSITDPTNDNAPYDLSTDPAFNSGPTSVNVTFAWPNRDYTNIGNDDGTEIIGSVGARVASVRVVGSSGPSSFLIDNGNGTYTLDTMLLDPPLVIPTTPEGLGSGTVSMEGHPAGDLGGEVGSFDDRLPVVNVTQAFAITDPQPIPRRVVVDVAKCQDCHGVADGLSFHGANRTDNTQHCATCHNGNATDLNRRPFDPDGVANNANSATIDGLEDQTVDFKYMIHAIHAAGMREEAYVAYGFGSRAFDFSEVTYPRSPADCEACHASADSYSLPLGPDVVATSVNTGATRIGNGEFAPSTVVARDPTDDNRLSPEGSVCVACHDSGFAIEHMSVRGTGFISFGNAFLANPDPILDPDTQEEIDMAGPENCSFCHGPGSFVDVRDVHDG